MNRYSASSVWVLGWVAICACSGSDETSDGRSAQSENEAVLPGLGDGEMSNGGTPDSLIEGAAVDSSTSSASSGAFPGTPGSGPSPTSAPTSAAPPAAGAPAPAGPADFDSGFASDEAPIGALPLAPPSDPSDPIIAPVTTPRPSPGTLTAGTWDDNLNFERFLSYRDEVTETTQGTLPFEEDEHREANERSGEFTGKETLDISLVIDTTGSMGDELRYLQSEFLALSESIEALYPNSDQRWSLVVYRDVGDEYEARWFDFRDDPKEFRTQLAQQTAGGGGDFPEAPERAFEAMNQLAWRTGEDTARLAFWVADAPHHAKRAAAMADAVRTTQALDIHVYPVASSGIDELTELSMRSVAQLTLGRYLFLTDDSGVGGAHKEPSIPCYFVTKLDTAILRMVDIELSGVYREPTADEVIRTGGDPQSRACTMSSGDVLWAY